MVGRKNEEIKYMSDELQTIFLANLDEAPARRRAREAFKDIQLAIDHCLFRVSNVSSLLSHFISLRFSKI